MKDTNRSHGIDAIEAMFRKADADGRAAFLPYFPIGFPDYEASLDAIVTMAEAGADGFEIGIPFSDPLADGPTIQAATQRALANGTTVKHCLMAVRSLRERGIDQPMMMMSYANPLVAYGVDDFVRDAREAGADGLIVPDLPPEEASMFSESCAREGLALIFFIAPTSDTARIRLAAQNATGFLYVVSLTGVTGARHDLPADLRELIARIREQTDTPLVLGFGISTADHARQLDGLVNGFIVGSAMVRAGEKGTDAVHDLTIALKSRKN